MEDRVAVPPVRARLKSFAARVAVDWAVPPKTASEKITETEVLSAVSYTHLTLPTICSV